MAEMTRISIQISIPHMWTRLFWFCWQKKLATASPKWVNLSRNSIQFFISSNAIAFYSFLCLWSSSLEWYMVCLCVYLFIFHCLLYYLNWTKHERSIISINCLKNANFLGFSILTRAYAYVVVVPHSYNTMYIWLWPVVYDYTVTVPFAISNEQCKWRMENSINVLLAMVI